MNTALGNNAFFTVERSALTTNLCAPFFEEFPSLRAKGTLISEPRVCDFSHARKGKRPFQRRNFSEKAIFPFLAWETSHLAGGREPGLTN